MVKRKVVNLLVLELKDLSIKAGFLNFSIWLARIISWISQSETRIWNRKKVYLLKHILFMMELLTNRKPKNLTLRNRRASKKTILIGRIQWGEFSLAHRFTLLIGWNELNLFRYALHEEWSRYKNCFKVQWTVFQVIWGQNFTLFDPSSLTSLTFRFWPWMNPLKPLDQVKNYFGEQIGLYFAFIGYYTFWLTWIALFGLGLALESHFYDCLLVILLANEIWFWA